MSTTAIIQPVNDTMMTLLDESSISDEQQQQQEDEEVQKQNILTYLNETNTYLTPKRVPRLGPYLLLKTLGVGEFGKVKIGRHVETGQTVGFKEEIRLT